MFDVVDAYCHCGLTKYRPIGDVKRVMERFDVSRKVLVQHLREYGNTYIQNIVAVEPGRFAGVLLVDVDDSAAGPLGRVQRISGHTIVGSLARDSLGYLGTGCRLGPGVRDLRRADPGFIYGTAGHVRRATSRDAAGPFQSWHAGSC